MAASGRHSSQPSRRSATWPCAPCSTWPYAGVADPADRRIAAVPAQLQRFGVGANRHGVAADLHLRHVGRLRAGSARRCAATGRPRCAPPSARRRRSRSRSAPAASRPPLACIWLHRSIRSGGALRMPAAISSAPPSCAASVMPPCAGTLNAAPGKAGWNAASRCGKPDGCSPGAERVGRHRQAARVAGDQHGAAERGQRAGRADPAHRRRAARRTAAAIGSAQPQAASRRRRARAGMQVARAPPCDAARGGRLHEVSDQAWHWFPVWKRPGSHLRTPPAQRLAGGAEKAASATTFHRHFLQIRSADPRLVAIGWRRAWPIGYSAYIATPH